MSTNSNSSGTNPPESIKSPVTSGETRQNQAAPPISRDRKGHFLPGSTPNPKGRPKGKLNQATLFARALLEESAPDIARQAIIEAKVGKSVALNLVLERLIPIATDRRVQLDNFTKPARAKFTDTLSPDDLLQAHNNLVRAVAEGELSPLEAQAISQLLEARRRSWESLELSKRLNELEDRFAESQRKR